MLESVYQGRLIKKLRRLFPGCIILKNDANYIDGIPDLTILWFGHWAVLEVKASKAAALRSIDKQPNQIWYVEKLNEMSFSAFIYPENEAEVLVALVHAFKSCGHPRIP